MADHITEEYCDALNIDICKMSQQFLRSVQIIDQKVIDKTKYQIAQYDNYCYLICEGVTQSTINTKSPKIPVAQYIEKLSALSLEYLRHYYFSSNMCNNSKATVLHLGVAGASLAYNLYEEVARICQNLSLKHFHFKQIGVDINQELIKFCREYFAFPPSSCFKVRINDALDEIRLAQNNSIDIIIRDCFVSGVSPIHLRTEEFYLNAFDKLKPNGILLLNILDYNSYHQILDYEVDLLKKYTSQMNFQKPKVYRITDKKQKERIINYLVMAKKSI